MNLPITRRAALAPLRSHLAAPEASLIVGPRQVGKTTLLKTLLAELAQQGRRQVFFNLDVEEDMRWFASQRSLLDRLSFLFGAPAQHTGERIVVAVDEVQRKSDAGRFFKGLHDLALPYKFVLTGSGSLELKEGVAESMAGRKRLFHIRPISLSEFVDHRTDYAYTERLSEFGQMEGARLQGLLLEYLNFGGFPRVVTATTPEEKRAVLHEIYASYVDRDITAFLRLTRPDAFRQMLAILASQNAQMLNLSALATQTALSTPTLKNYLYYAEKTFAIDLLAPYFRNAQKEITKAQCPYFVDIGMRNLVLGRFGNLSQGPELGLVFQNLALHLLQARFADAQIKTWRTLDKAEVDFVVDSPALGILPVEVKYSQLAHKDGKSKAPLARSLRSFIEKYQPAEAWVLNLSLTHSEMLGSTRLRYVALHELL
jgi:uncharacterized protein